MSASSAAPQKRKAEEVANTDRTGPQRVAQLASDLRLPLMVLLKKTDGPQGADFLAKKVARGEMTLDDVRRRLGRAPEGALEGNEDGPTVDPERPREGAKVLVA